MTQGYLIAAIFYTTDGRSTTQKLPVRAGKLLHSVPCALMAVRMDMAPLTVFNAARLGAKTYRNRQNLRKIPETGNFLQAARTNNRKYGCGNVACIAGTRIWRQTTALNVPGRSEYRPDPFTVHKEIRKCLRQTGHQGV